MGAAAKSAARPRRRAPRLEAAGRGSAGQRGAGKSNRRSWGAMLNLLIVLAGLVVLIASAVFGIFLPLSRGSTTVAGQRIVPPPKVHLLNGIVGGAIGGVIMIIGFAGPFVEVPAGNVGVVTNFGQVQTVTLEPGLHVVVPIYQHVTNVDTRVQPHRFEEIDAASRELQTVKLTGTMNYH